MRLTQKYIRDYIIDNYGELRHDVKVMAKASQKVAKMYKVRSIDIFHFIIENEDIPGLYVNSYGFNTRLGREIKDNFSGVYYSLS